MATHLISGTNDKTKWALARPAQTGGAVADPGTMNEATYPAATYGFPCTTYETVLVRPFFTGSGTVVLEAMFYDEEALVWVHWVQPAGGNNVTPALHNDEAFELKVFGRTKVFFRVVTIAGTVTNLEVTCIPGTPRLGSFFK